MKRTLLFLFFFLLFPLLATPAAWAGETEKEVKGEIEVGARGLAYDKDRARVGEFDRLNNLSGIGRIELDGKFDSIYFDLEGLYTDDKDQAYGFGLDISRIFQADFDYNRFWHWLDHDTLENLDAAILPPGILPNPLPLDLPGNNLNDPLSASSPIDATNNTIGRQTVYSTDLHPGKDYYLIYDNAQLNTELLIPQAPGLKLYVDVRRESRHGLEQGRAISHCSSCHVVGMDKRIDEEMWDKKVGAEFKTGILTLDYSFLDREFDEQSGPPRNYYDPAIHPVSSNPNVFRTRIGYDYDSFLTSEDTTYANGIALPFYSVPDSSKYSHVVKANLDLPHMMNAFASYVNTEIENDSNSAEIGYDGSEMNYDSYALRFNSMIGKRLSLSFKGRYEEIDNDDVYVALYEPEHVAPPAPGAAGLTYAEWILGIPTLQFERESVMDRDVLTLGFDAKYRLARWTTLRFLYEYENIDRDNFEAADDTDMHTVKLAMNSRARKNLTYNVSYKYQNISDVFENEKGGCAPSTSLGFDDNSAASPNWFLIQPDRQYDEAVYSKRQALTNEPTDVHQFVGKTTWSPRSDFSATLSYTFKYQENDDLALLTWEETTHNPGVTFWYTPTEKLALTAAYDFMYDETKSKICVALYDG